MCIKYRGAAYQQLMVQIKGRCMCCNYKNLSGSTQNFTGTFSEDLDGIFLQA